MKKLALSIFTLGAVLSSCSKDDDGGNTANQIISKTTGIDITGVNVPSSYEFTRNGATTVSYSGQTTRLNQVAAIGININSQTSTLMSLENNFKIGEGFLEASLNGTGKQIRDKVASSLGLFNKGNSNNADAIKAVFDGYITGYINEVQQAVGDSIIATRGNAGIADSIRNVNGDGLQYNQAFLKSLIGGLAIDQISNHYFNRLDDDNFDGTNGFRLENDEAVLDGSDNFTIMEHHWDEAYGYVYGVAASEDELLQKYINRVELDDDFKGTAQTIVDAFIIGRAAIVAKNYEVRDAAIAVIREELGKIIGIRSVYYLQQAKLKLAEREKAFHDLAEGYGFIYSLQFVTLDGQTPLFTQAEVAQFINTLEAADGFWDITSTQLDEMSNTIAAKFSFTVAEAATLDGI